MGSWLDFNARASLVAAGVVAAGAGALTVAMPVAHACSLVAATPFVVTSDPDDVTPPTAFDSVEVDVNRGECGLNSDIEADCGGHSTIAFRATGATDEGSGRIGIHLRFLEGKYPDELLIQEGDEAAYEFVGDSQAFLSFGEGTDESHEAIDFSVEVAPIDRWGNIGAATVVEVKDSGGRCDGCSVAPGASTPRGAAALLFLFVTGGLRLRRRQGLRGRP